ncbi:MAG: aldehyde dehydrogenase family protein [Deltaproteobacteria bacterium]|nr:aldehyde dehydrogenase family protein [Deltaproteobacteria bacterium]
MSETVLNYIGGEWSRAQSGATAERRNPACTDELVATFPRSGREDVEKAVRAAREAFEGWRRTPAPRRGDILFRALRLFELRKEEVARAMTREEGKTLRESRGEVQKSLNVLEFVAGEARRLNGETVPSEMPSTFCYTVREPLGVVAVITPWNFPVAIPAWKIAPALVAGNTVVFKPASATPVTARILVEVLVEAGVPRGVLNLVYGDGGSIGSMLVDHPDVRAVSFTGSNEVGSKLHADAAKTHKKVLCEMGGKNPLVVLEDADVELAAVAAAQGAFGSTGQRCTATSRAIVARSRLEEFLRYVEREARAIVVGDGMKESTTMGPCVDERQHRTVLEYLAIARDEGARFVTGGDRLSASALQMGYFVPPTILADVKPSMRVAQEEIFGPVLSVIAVDSFEEAIEVSNDVRYGLAASIYTEDVERVMRFIDRIEVGIVHINSPTVGGEAQLPFGGMKATGVGGREMGRTAIEFFTEWKTVYVDYTGSKRETNIY